jgi:hypothetical protein
VTGRHGNAPFGEVESGEWRVEGEEWRVESGTGRR